MRRGTTPTIIFRVASADGEPLDLTEQDVYVTFKAKGASGAEITRKNPLMAYEDGSTTVTVVLTQQETLRFRDGQTVRIQVRCTDGTNAQASTIVEVKAEEILKGGVI